MRGSRPGCNSRRPTPTSSTFALTRAETLYRDAGQRCAGCGSTACAPTCPGAGRRGATPPSIARSRRPPPRPARWPRRDVETGAPEPLGVTLTPNGVNVAVFSAHAERIEFCLFDAAGERQTECLALPGRTGDVFHGAISGVAAGARYGLRAIGPFDPARGHRFDGSKLLADPYAAALDRPYKLHPAMFERGADSGPVAPKAIVAALAPAEPGRLRIPWARTILYEVNLRGFTRLHPEIPEALRGTFAGLAHPRAIAHLAGLGVTSVEIMPADAFCDERHLPPLGLTNAWGYNPVILGAPDPRLAPGGWAEVRQATDALHEAGLEAILDVVLNHSAESDEFGPTLALRGLDNAAYYRLLPDDPARYVNDMGCGNCLALDRPAVWAMAIAALRRWMVQGGFDGFRFDLAPALGRRDWGFDAKAPLIEALGEDPVLRGAKLIAEPWDIGPGGYQLGAFPGAGANGTTATATPRAGSGAAIRICAARSRPGSPARAISSAARRRPRRASISSPPMTASRSPISSPTTASTTRPTARTTATGPTTIARGTTARKGRPRSRDRGGARARHAQPARAADGLARRADAVDGIGDRPQPAGQQQRLCPGQCDFLDRLGQGRPLALRLRRAADRGAQAHPALATTPS